MPKYEFICDKCGKYVETYMSYEKAKEGFICDCGGHFEKQFSPANIVGCNRFIYKPGVDPAVERQRAQKSMEEKAERGEYIKVGDSYQKRGKK